MHKYQSTHPLDALSSSFSNSFDLNVLNVTSLLESSKLLLYSLTLPNTSVIEAKEVREEEEQDISSNPES